MDETETGSESGVETVFQEIISTKSRPISQMSTRIPSQAGLKAAFSRPVTGVNDLRGKTVDEEEIDEVLLTELKEITKYNESVEYSTLPYQRDHRKCSVTKPPPDIFSDANWETDLDSDDESDDEEDDFRSFYVSVCQKLGVIPTSYFNRHIEDCEISLKHHGLNTNETTAIAAALQKVLNIESLDVSSNFMSNKSCKYLCSVLENNHTLKELDIGDNGLGDSSVEVITKMLTNNNSLQVLNLTNNRLTDQSIALLADSIEDCKLKHLDLSKNHFSNVGGQLLGPAISTNVYMEKINLSWNKIRSPGAMSIAKGLKDNMRLCSCDLSWNGFGEDGGLAIADALIGNAVLKELNLSSNRLTLAVAQKISKALLVNESLEVLNMSDNAITTTGCISLATSVNTSQTSVLKSLLLHGNPVEYEFLCIIKEISKKRPEFICTHGSILRSGNTSEDIGREAIDIERLKRKPVMILKQNLIINNREKFKLIVKKHNTNRDKESISPEDLITAILELDKDLNNKMVNTAVSKIQLDDNQLISIRNLLSEE